MIRRDGRETHPHRARCAKPTAFPPRGSTRGSAIKGHREVVGRRRAPDGPLCARSAGRSALLEALVVAESSRGSSRHGRPFNTWLFAQSASTPPGSRWTAGSVRLDCEAHAQVSLARTWAGNSATIADSQSCSRRAHVRAVAGQCQESVRVSGKELPDTTNHAGLAGHCAR